MIVADVAGESHFTQDPSRHTFTEAVTPVLHLNRPIYVLPERRVTQLLVDSYFAHVRCPICRYCTC